MKTKTAPLIPSVTELRAALRKSQTIWDKLIISVAKDFPGLRQEWKPSKLQFGRVCLLKSGGRTLLYLIPGSATFEISVVLGERAVAIALTSDLPQSVKKLIAEARQYAEGRGIRFRVSSADQIPVIRKLVVIKTTPK